MMQEPFESSRALGNGNGFECEGGTKLNEPHENKALDDVVIRPVDLNKDDFNAIVKIFVDGMGEIGARNYIRKSLGEDMNRVNFESIYLDKNKRGNFWVAIKNDGIIGIVGLEQKDEETCELKRLSIKKDFRGKSLGFRLAKCVLDHAKNKNFKTCYLSTLDSMCAARAIYSRLGFVLEESSELTTVKKNTVAMVIHYSIDLDNYNGDGGTNTAWIKA